MECEERQLSGGRYSTAVRDAVEVARGDRRLMSLILRTCKQTNRLNSAIPGADTTVSSEGELWRTLYAIRRINVDRSKWRPLLLAEMVDKVYDQTGGFTVPWGGMSVAEPTTTINDRTLARLATRLGSWRTPDGVSEMIELGLPDIVVLEALRYSRYRRVMSPRVTTLWLQIAEGRRGATGVTLGPHTGAALRGILLSTLLLKDVQYPEVFSSLHSNLITHGVTEDAALKICDWFNAGDLLVIENVIRQAPGPSRDEVVCRICKDCMEARRLGLGHRATGALLECWTDMVTSMHGGTTYPSVSSSSGGCFRSMKLYSAVGVGQSHYSDPSMLLSRALRLSSSSTVGYCVRDDGSVCAIDDALSDDGTMREGYLPAESAAFGDSDALIRHMAATYGTEMSVQYKGTSRRYDRTTFVPYSMLQAHEAVAVLSMKKVGASDPLPTVWLQGSFDPHYISDTVVAAEEARRVPGPIGGTALGVLRRLYEDVEASRALSGNFWPDQLLTASAEGVIQAPWYQTERESLSHMSDSSLLTVIERDVATVDMRVYEKSMEGYSCEVPCTIMANSGAVIAAARRSRGGVQLTAKAHSMRAFLNCAPAKFTLWDRCGVLSLQPKYWMDVPAGYKDGRLERSVLKHATGSAYTPVDSACYTSSDPRLARAGALDIASAAMYYIGVRLTGMRYGRFEFEEVVRRRVPYSIEHENFTQPKRTDVISTSAVICTGGDSLMGHLEDCRSEKLRGMPCSRVPVYVKGLSRRRQVRENWLDGMEYCTRARVCRSVTPLYRVSEAMRAAGFVRCGDEYTYGKAKKAYPLSVRAGQRNRYAVRVRKYPKWKSLLCDSWFIELCSSVPRMQRDRARNGSCREARGTNRIT